MEIAEAKTTLVVQWHSHFKEGFPKCPVLQNWTTGKPGFTKLANSLPREQDLNPPNIHFSSSSTSVTQTERPFPQLPPSPHVT